MLLKRGTEALPVAVRDAGIAATTPLARRSGSVRPYPSSSERYAEEELFGMPLFGQLYPGRRRLFAGLNKDQRRTGKSKKPADSHALVWPI